MSSRYRVSGAEGEFESGSDDRVLRNLLGINSVTDMDELELELLLQLYEEVLVQGFPEGTLCVKDLQHWHRLWLGNVYAWAGQVRSVNMGKGGFAFASAAQIPRLLSDFDRNFLARWTPCDQLSLAELVEAIAVTHVEFILIHPFREGNGRLSRLLADVMAVQGNHAPLDYSEWERRKSEYVKAIHAGFAGNYDPMCAFVQEAIDAGDRNLSEPT
jgi:cell filamentation protein